MRAGVRRIGVGEKGAHLVVGYLAEIHVVHAHGIERVGRAEAYDLVGDFGERFQ